MFFYRGKLVNENIKAFFEELLTVKEEEINNNFNHKRLKIFFKHLRIFENL